tara:strand:- start:633 stop:791 length:159 start_codon:yes stop_codon:yes gene_type:complete
MEPENAERVRKIIEHFSIFRRMTLLEADAILKVCKLRTYAKGELIVQEVTRC